MKLFSRSFNSQRHATYLLVYITYNANNIRGYSVVSQNIPESISADQVEGWPEVMKVGIVLCQIADTTP